MADRTLNFLTDITIEAVMATKQTRGTKRTCQNTACGQKFYDLEHDPIMCPVCGTNFNLAATAAYIAAALASEKAARKAASKKPMYAAAPEVVTDEATLVDGADVLPEIESEDEPVAAEADETFLEDEEEEGDVSNIIGGVTEGDEEP
jgi:uncharacterized protein (TIGR02300 family)